MLAFGTAAPEMGQERAELARWAASAAAVLAVYAAAIAVLMTWTSSAPPPITLPPAATMIDLAPLPPSPQPVVAPPPPPPEIKPEPKRVVRPARVRPPPPPPPKAVQLPAPLPVAVPAPPVAAAPPAPAPVTAPPVPAQPLPDVLSAFEARLIAHLERYKHYPQSARSRSQQGVVRLRFTMDRSGHVLSARIAQSSGVPALDDEVLTMIDRAAPLPSFPPEIPQAQLDLLLPISFSLR